MTRYKGYIHSIETLGLVDGPGLRIVIFMQGCNLRCMYCHNPDTWQKNIGKTFEPLDIVNEIRKYRHYFTGNGGVTFSGGEPLVQSSFLLETLKLCKKAGINTCIDTAGTGYNVRKLKDILKYSDEVILDIKATDEKNYKLITGKGIEEVELFIKYLNNSSTKVWLRQVIVPGLNDTKENILALKEYSKKINNVEKIELLPYHTMGVAKYKKMGIKYRLNGVSDMSQEKIQELNKILID